MTPHVWKHNNACLLALGLLVGVLLAGFRSVQATQPGLAPSSVQPASTPTPAWNCIVKTDFLNFYEGPGTNYKKLPTLPKGRQTRPLATSPDGKWIQVVVISDKTTTGWVSFNLKFIDCTVQPTQLPPGVVPPTPTVPSVAPTPTPPAIGYSAAPSAGGNPNGLVGNVRLLGKPGVVVDGSPEYVFRDRLGIEMRVRDPDVASGLGIHYVEFSISGDGYYFNSDDAAPYCLFPDHGETCDNVWPIRQPDGTLKGPSNEPIDPNTVYEAEIRAVSEDEDKVGNWNFKFRIIPADRAEDAFYRLRSVNSHSDYDAEVRAPYDTVVSDSDLITAFRNPVSFRLAFDDFSGKDVAKVEFKVWDSDTGKIIHQKGEDNAPYCVNGNNGNQPCNPLRLEPGRIYQVFMIGRDSTGNKVGNWDFQFTVQ